MHINPLLTTDSYKLSHYEFYPENVEYISSYIESRGGDYDFNLFFGLQMFLSELKPFTQEDIEEYVEDCVAHGFEPNRADFETILKEYDGHFPVRIQALPEGSVVKTKTPLVQITNTDPRFPWVVSYMETALLRAVWYPTTVATRSKHIKNIIAKYLEKTSDTPEGVLPFRLHDFGARGASSYETATLGGAAHLVNFLGTDTVSALRAVRRYYGEPMAGFSIPATEHSISTCYGRKGEEEYLNTVLEVLESGRFPFVACVSDTYDIYNFVENVICDPENVERIKKTGKTLVVRPDSGEPNHIVTFVLETLGKAFGVATNSKGFKVLHPSVRVVQGDGMNDKSIESLLAHISSMGWSTENIVVGMGGGLLQSLNRDTLKFAMKASAMKLRGHDKWLEIFKDPVTDPGKVSKKGRLAVITTYGSPLQAIKEEWLDPGEGNYLEDVWDTGKFLRYQTFDDIRKISNYSRNF